MHAHAGRRAAAKSRSNRRDIRRQALSIMESLEPRTLMSSTVLGTAAAGGDYASIKYTEDDGTVVTVALSGPGTATIEWDGDFDVLGGRTPRIDGEAYINSITLDSTTNKSVLTFTTAGSDRHAAVGPITGTGVALKTLAADFVDLQEGLSIDGGVGTVKLGDVTGNLDFGTASTPMTFTAGVVGGNFSYDGPVTSIKVASWSGAAALGATSVGTITATNGDWSPDITAPGGIKSITVTGGDLGGTISCEDGAIGTITVTGKAYFDSDAGEGSVVGGGMTSSIIVGQVKGKSIGNITLTGGGSGGEGGDLDVNAAGDIGNILVKPLTYLATIEQQEVLDKNGDPKVDRNGDPIYRNVRIMNQQGGGILASLDTAGKLGNLTAAGGDIAGTIHAAKGMGNIVAQSILQTTAGNYSGIPYTTDPEGVLVSNLTAALTAEAGAAGIAIASISVQGGDWTGGAHVTGSIGKITTKCYAIVSDMGEFPAEGSWEKLGGGIQGQIIADSIGAISINGGTWGGSMVAMTGGIGKIDVLIGSMQADLTAYSSIGAITLKNVAIPATNRVDKWTEDGETNYDPFSTVGYVVGGDLNVTIHLGYQSDGDGNYIENEDGPIINTRATLGAISGIGASVNVTGEVPWGWVQGHPRITSTLVTYVAGYDWDDEKHKFTKWDEPGAAGGEESCSVDLINSTEVAQFNYSA